MDTLLPYLNNPFLGTAAWIWLVFAGIVVTLLVLDLGVLGLRALYFALAAMIHRFT